MSSNKKFIPCRACIAREKQGIKTPQGSDGKPQYGYYYDNYNGYEVIKECECHKKWREAYELSRKLERSGLSQDYTFDDYRGTESLEQLNALKQIASNFPKFAHKKMIYVWGKNGTQKTSMVQALGKSLVEQGYSVQYLLMNTLLNNLVKDFDTGNQEEKDAFIRKCADVDFLIIDEAFDSTKTTIYKSGYQVPFLDAFIRSRFETGNKSILFVSNKLPEEIESQGFGGSIQNLVIRNTKQSFLEFKDVYVDNTNTVDRMGLFR